MTLQESLQRYEGLFAFAITYVWGSLWLVSAITIITLKVVSVVLNVLYVFLLSARIYLYIQARKRIEKRPFNLQQMAGVHILLRKSLWKARLM